MEGRVRRQGEVGRALKAAWPGRDGQAGVAARRARRRMAATRRGRSDMVGHGAWEQAQRGAKAGRAGVSGWAESEAAAHSSEM